MGNSTDYTKLMARRIRRILLVCNNYDSFSLEEDGHIEQLITQEYSELNLSNPPAIVRAESTLEALEVLKEDTGFDLIITMYNVGKLDVFGFSLQAKELAPDTPIVLLSSFSREIYRKIIAAGAKHPHAPVTHYLHKFAFSSSGTLPMINIPSIAGTGAECTVGAVVKNKQGTKSSTVIMGLEVAAVILDSELLIGAPQSVTTWCAIDALSHGLEGLLADVESSEEDVFKSRECVRLVLENLPIMLTDPKNIDARQATLLAAHYGGNAINTQLAGYVHAFAHSIGALYHIPHGKAIAWCLVPIVEAQENLRYDAMADLARHCRVAEDGDSREAAADKLILALKGLLDRCGLEKGCRLLDEKDYDRLTAMIDADSINYSPSRTFSDSEIRMLLDQIRRGY